MSNDVGNNEARQNLIQKIEICGPVTAEGRARIMLTKPECDLILASLRSPAGSEGWQPIETKPQWEAVEERGVYTDDGGGLFYFKATHWRPLVSATEQQP